MAIAVEEETPDAYYVSDDMNKQALTKRGRKLGKVHPGQLEKINRSRVWAQSQLRLQGVW